ncbi:hypothetical protein GRQ63_30645 [Streptomyces sp. YIM 132580]|nr:hypothetical protein [Streptomyces sp. YIM 132580]
MPSGDGTPDQAAGQGASACLTAGHRIRLSLSTSYRPLVRPLPEPALLTVHGDGAAADRPQEPGGPPLRPRHREGPGPPETEAAAVPVLRRPSASAAAEPPGSWSPRRPGPRRAAAG